MGRENKPREELEHEHSPEAIQQRLQQSDHQHGAMGDFVLGAVDGAVTTFAIVSGVAGAELHVSVAIVLGVANVVADGFSMAAGNYLKVRADQEQLDRYRALETRHIQLEPEGEKEEIRQIFREKGFEGEALENIVETIAANESLWVDTMLTDEWGLALNQPNAVRSGAITFISFLLAGMIPLAPLFLSGYLSPTTTWTASAVATSLTFLGVGALRGWIAKQSIWYGALETLGVGGAAALLAYSIGALLRGFVETTPL